MARPREFEYETALGGAMDIFWRQGYRATNLPELLDAMGLTRGSFYKAFGEKEATYLQALDHYDAKVVSRAVEMLETCDLETATACLAQLFQSDASDNRGCFICNAMVEMGVDNPAVASKANAMAARLRDAILNVLDRFPGTAKAANRSEMADLILHLYFGKQAMGKSGGPSADWEMRLKALLEE
ncbi:MAG: TetR/AcrR family transcriptional regulator [Pseudomonadota bacterium]